MSDSITEVSEKSWGARLMESIKGVLVGLALFVAAFPVLFMNEGCAVKTARDLGNLAKEVVSVDALKIDPANNGKPVHMSGDAKTDEVLTDSAFNYSANAIHLGRSVEMFQWIEDRKEKTEKQVGGSEKTTTTYEYRTGWSSSAIDSSTFKQPDGHRNPGSMPYEAISLSAKNVLLGSYRLIPAQISQISGKETVNFTAAEIAKLPPAIRAKAKPSGEWLFLGANAQQPQVGDVRIRLDVVKSPKAISVIAVQNGDTFQAYRGKEGTQQLLVSTGTIDAAGMVQSAQDANVTRTWIVRFVGLVMMYLGLMMVFKPLVTVADVLPMLGGLLKIGLGLFSGIIAFALSLVTIAIAWIFYRPVLAIILLALAGGAIAFGIMKSRQKKAAAAA
ncbi:MAG: TMEM43 family protein [Spirochaetes bacterium]|nr:TMEM43 family protein [Spirochaetota bacterium]